MCGIAGIVSSNPSELQPRYIQSMIKAIEHRGPNGKGFWVNPKETVALGHARLSIIDLSDEAAQPMHYMGRYSIVYNGELYNYIELRKELQKSGYAFKTNSDTEVILAAYDCYKESCLHYFDGMFAFAIWDEYDQKLFGARDRFGEKPFFYFKDHNRFLFASEMKSLWSIGVAKNVDDRMLLNYISFGQVQNPVNKAQTFFEDIQSLPPAHYFTYGQKIFSIQSYWKLDKQFSIKISLNDAIDRIDELLKLSVRRRLRADVNIGLSLSGGLDSSTLLDFVSSEGKQKLNTFSVVFPGFEKDESASITELNTIYQTQSHWISPTAIDLASEFETMMWHQEEPIPSSSVFAQYCLYKKASFQGIHVLIDGQGSDEIFAGYHKYAHWYLQEKINRYKFLFSLKEKKKMREHGIDFRWDIRNWLAAFFPSHVAIALEKKAYQKIMHQPDLSTEMLEKLKGRAWEGIHKPIVTKLNDILCFDVMEMGLESLLKFSDRNAMANGSEVRMPFLYHELLSFVFSLPSEYKISNGYHKSILRQLMHQRLPDSITWKKEKIGFEPPQQAWMASPQMKELVHEAKRKLIAKGVLKKEVINRINKPTHAHEEDSYDWRYLSLASVI